MNLNVKLILLLTLLVLLAVTGGCNRGNSDEAKQEVKPSPILTLPPREVLSRQGIIASVTTITPAFLDETGSEEITGTIVYDPRQATVISARVSGRIEKLNLTYFNQRVTKGQRVAELYSPELVAAQKEYLLLRSRPERATFSFLKSHRERLMLLGMTESEIAYLDRTGKPIERIGIVSPANGFLMIQQASEGKTSSQTDASQRGDMANMGKLEQAAPMENQQASPLLREGMYVAKGQEMFTLTNTNEVWALLYVPNVLANKIAEGQPVEISVPSGTDFMKARIDLIEPVYSTTQNRLVARVYLPNKVGKFNVGMSVKARIHFKGMKVLAVPSTAVLHLGKRAIVWIKKGSNYFESKEIVTGLLLGKNTSITAGLSPKDTIAENAAYLKDPETLIAE